MNFASLALDCVPFIRRILVHCLLSPVFIAVVLWVFSTVFSRNCRINPVSKQSYLLFEAVAYFTSSDKRVSDSSAYCNISVVSVMQLICCCCCCCPAL